MNVPSACRRTSIIRNDALILPHPRTNSDGIFGSDRYGTLISRLDNKNTDPIILVMQRLHEDDLAAHLLQQGHWHHVSMPAIAEEPESHPIGFGRRFERSPGDVLDPERESREVLQHLKAEMGSAAFSAQYQQAPVPAQGNRVKWAWFRTFDKTPPINPYDQVIISWDTAVKDREIHDYSVGIVALKKSDGNIYILDVVRERFHFPALKAAVEQQAANYKGSTTLIEDAGSGSALIQTLRYESDCTVIAIKPEGDKVVRFDAVTPMIEAGRVLLPTDAHWMDPFQREIMAFPDSARDDQIDALSQLLGWINRPRHWATRGRDRCA